MPRRAKALVFDSWALLAYLEGEAPAERVAQLITDAHEHRIPLYMSCINAGEVWYIIAREISEEEADKAVANLRHLGIQFLEATWALAKIAGTLKSRYKMSYADCFAAAQAKSLKSPLITGDKEFKQVEGEVDVTWL